jgi:flavin reductase (DIM6/NTAB) family NADH-FMN oxidoreductase RutF
MTRDPLMTASRSSRLRTEADAVDPASFRAALGKFITGVTVITTRVADGAAVGVTVSSFNTLSLDPPLILWSLALSAPSLERFRAAEHFAVNILAQDQSALAFQFAKPSPDKFHSVETLDGLAGIPLIAGAAAQLECRVEARHPGGDHELVIGRVIRALSTSRPPLVYGHGQFGNFRSPALEGACQQ